MKMKLIIFLFLFSITFLVSISVISARDISYCQEISESGSYRLINNIRKDSSICFNILVSNVEIDCKNHFVEGNNTGDDYAFKTQNTKNITIKNCKIINWLYPIYMRNVTSSEIKDNYIEAPMQNSGIAFYFVSYTNYTNNIVNNSYSGIGGDNNDYLRIINNTFNGRLVGGFSAALYFDNEGDNNFIKDIKIKGFNRGIILENVTNNIFQNIEIEDIIFPYEYGNYPSIAIEFTCWGDCARENYISNFTIKNTIPNMFSPYPNCAVAFIGNSRNNMLIDGNISSPLEERYGTYDLCIIRNLYFGRKINYSIPINNTVLNVNYSSAAFNPIFKEGNADFYRMKYHRIDVKDSNDKAIENASISIYDNNGNIVKQGLTNKQGSATFNLTEFLYRKRDSENGSITYFSNYTIIINHSSYSRSYEVNITDDTLLHRYFLSILLFHSRKAIFGRYETNNISDNYHLSKSSICATPMLLAVMISVILLIILIITRMNKKK
jgi:hypothetical protein